MHQMMAEFKVSSRLGGGFSSYSAPAPQPAPSFQSSASGWESDGDYAGGVSDNPFTGAKY